MTQEDVVTAPGFDQVGWIDHWILPGVGEPIILDGTFLGMSSSRRTEHRGHDDTEFAPQGIRCSACRWFEPRIFRETDEPKRFLLHQTGVSIVPGETNRIRLEYALTGEEVIAVMVTRRSLPNGSQDAFLTMPASRVLAQASAFDDELRVAYQNRLGKLAG